MKQKDRVFHSLEEIDKEFWPNLLKEATALELQKEPASFSVFVVQELLEKAKEQLEK